MPNVPTWLLGSGVTAFTLTGATAGADGTLTDATGSGVQVMTGLWEELDIRRQPRTEEISSADATRENNVKVKDAYTARCTQIMQSAKAAGQTSNNVVNPLSHIATTYDYVKMVATRGGKAWSFYGLVSGYDEGLRASKSIATLDLIMVDPSAANPSLS